MVLVVGSTHFRIVVGSIHSVDDVVFSTHFVVLVVGATHSFVLVVGATHSLVVVVGAAGFLLVVTGALPPPEPSAKLQSTARTPSPKSAKYSKRPWVKSSAQGE